MPSLAVLETAEADHDVDQLDIVAVVDLVIAVRREGAADSPVADTDLTDVFIAFRDTRGGDSEIWF